MLWVDQALSQWPGAEFQALLRIVLGLNRKLQKTTNDIRSDQWFRAVSADWWFAGRLNRRNEVVGIND